MAGVMQRTWNGRVSQWHEHVTSAAAFKNVLDAVLRVAQARKEDVCVDLGAGTGFLTFAIAPDVASVLAVDISERMLDSLTEAAREKGLTNVATAVCDLAEFTLPADSVDLIVSNYTLHHLLDADKRALVAKCLTWLRPGGRIVIADMMFGRGASTRDRQILIQKVAALAAKGPGGWWRIAKNLFRFGLGVGTEHPATPDVWVRALRDAGFADVSFEPVVAEAGLVQGRRPA